MRREALCAKRLLVAVIVLAMLITSTVDILSYADSEERISVINGTVAESGCIMSFETKNPVYSIYAERGTQFNDLGLPETLRAVLSVTEDEKSSFVQVLPEIESDGDYAFFQYGYVQESNAIEKFEKGEPVLYTVLYADGTEAYRIYGRVGEEEPRFFACDEKGRIIGQVANVEVTWDESQYSSEIYDVIQTLEPKWSDKLSYDGDKVVAEITVQSDSSTKKAGTAKTQSASGIAVQASEDTAYEQAMKAMRASTPTSGNDAPKDSYGSGIPGTWVDYINTIWQYQTTTNPFTFTENTGVADEWKWNGKAASEDGDPATNPNAKPTMTGNSKKTFEVYSAAQMRYALEQVQEEANKRSYADVTINVNNDLDFNGSNYNWSPTIYYNNLTIDGKNHTFYNICSYRQDDQKGDEGMTGAFIEYKKTGNGVYSIRNRFIFKDITFQSFMSVTYRLSGGGIFGFADNAKGNYGSKERQTKVTNVTVRDSLFYNGAKNNPNYASKPKSGYISPFGAFPGAASSKNADSGVGKTITFDSCRVIGTKIYGSNHIAGFVSRAYYGAKLDKCFVTDTILCGTGGHSGGFLSCQTGTCYSTNCFSNINMYSSKEAGGFSGTVKGTFDNCYSTGKLEGYSALGGFIQKKGVSDEQDDTETYAPYQITNCYSTMLVGMRSKSKNMGGFIENTEELVKMENCYAAGEVGDTQTDSRTKESSYNNVAAGGFARYIDSWPDIENCYYDKQTTAMREWITASDNEERGDKVDGLTGVLTTTTAKAGAGLTASLNTVTSATSGFTGFTDNSKWVFKEGYYPQLAAMTNPGADWGNEEIRALVKANSLASVSTVYLDTWDNGYDWSNKGVRSEKEISYARTKDEALKNSEKNSYSDHVGYKYTYDTVREIISDFKTTPTKFTNAVNGGKGANTKVIKADESTDTLKGAIQISENGTGKIVVPGMEWFNIQGTGTVESKNKNAYRPIRLTSLMKVEAGEDQKLKVSSLYNHTLDARFTIMDEITDDRVIGMHDDQFWSQSKEQKYPETNKYYEAVTNKTSFPASESAWVYTEIWLVGEETDGVYKELANPKSVRVTGEGTNGSNITTTEKQWLGQLPIGSGMHSGMKFKITYYWMLSDGRYCTDSKYVTLIPSEYSLTESVYNRNGTENSTALYLGTVEENKNAKDPGYIIDKSSTRQIAKILNKPEGTHIIAAWEKNPQQDLDVVKLELQFSNNGIKMSDNAVLENKGSIVKTGDTITVNATYYGYDEKEETSAPGGAYDRMVLSYEPVTVKLTYKVEETTIDGRTIQYLILDHEATIKDNQFEEKAGTSAKVTQPSVTGYNKLNLVMKGIDFDVDVKLTVPNRCNLKVIKSDDSTEQKKLTGVKFKLYREDASSSGDAPNVTLQGLLAGNKYATDVYLNANRTIPVTDQEISTDAEGLIKLYGLNENAYYYLVETKPIKGYASSGTMIRINLDYATNTVVVQELNADGSTHDEPAVWHYSNDITVPTGDKKMNSDDFASVQIFNREMIDLPVTGGEGIIHLIIFAFLSCALAIALAIKRRASIDKK